jgi:hypothetical protein
MNLEICYVGCVDCGGSGGASSCIKYEIFIVDFVAGKL